MSFDKLEKKIKRSLYGYKSTGELEQEWQLLEKRLDQKKKKDKVFIWWFFGFCAVFFLGFHLYNSYKLNYTENNLVTNTQTLPSKNIVSQPKSITTTATSSIDISISNPTDNRKPNKTGISKPNKPSSTSQLNQGRTAILDITPTDEPTAIASHQQQEELEVKEKIVPLGKLPVPILTSINFNSLVSDTPLLVSLEEVKVEKSFNDTKWKFQLLSGLSLTQNNYSSNDGGRIRYLRALEDSEASLESIFSGIHIHRNLSKNFSVFSGVEITVLNERFTGTDFVKESNAINSKVFRRVYQYYNQHHFLDIPLGITYSINKRKMGYSFSIGGNYNLYMKNKGIGLNEEFKVVSLEETPLYAKNKGFTSFFMPNAQWKINKELSLNTGIRFQYGHGNLLNATLYEKQQIGYGIIIGIQWTPIK